MACSRIPKCRVRPYGLASQCAVLAASGPNEFESPRPAVKEPLSIGEARNLLVAIEDERNHVLWTTMLMLGLRRSEVCGLRWEDIDFEKQTLRVAQSVQRFDGKLHELPTKTRRSNRTIPLPPRVLAALTERALGHNVLPGAIGGHGYVFAPGMAHRWSRGT